MLFLLWVMVSKLYLSLNCKKIPIISTIIPYIFVVKLDQNYVKSWIMLQHPSTHQKPHLKDHHLHIYEQ